MLNLGKGEHSQYTLEGRKQERDWQQCLDNKLKRGDENSNEYKESEVRHAFGLEFVYQESPFWLVFQHFTRFRNGWKFGTIV